MTHATFTPVTVEINQSYNPANKQWPDEIFVALRMASSLLQTLNGI